MENILFVKMTVTNGRRNYINITKYKVKKVTDKRVYYYSIFDEDTTEDDVKYIEKERFKNCMTKNIGESAIVSALWCDEKDLQQTKETVANELKKHITILLNNIESCFTHSNIRSTVKI